MNTSDLENIIHFYIFVWHFNIPRDGQTIEARTTAAAIAQHVRTEIIHERTSFFSILHELDFLDS